MGPSQESHSGSTVEFLAGWKTDAHFIDIYTINHSDISSHV